MQERASARVKSGRGLEGNANQGGKRQITLLHAERWLDLTAPLGDVQPILRRANLLVSGIDLERSENRILRVGKCRLRILGETDPCGRMDEAWPGLQAALRHRWGGGAFAEALNDGEIAIGDTVTWEDRRTAERGCSVSSG